MSKKDEHKSGSKISKREGKIETGSAGKCGTEAAFQFLIQRKPQHSTARWFAALRNLPAHSRQCFSSASVLQTHTHTQQRRCGSAVRRSEL